MIGSSKALYTAKQAGAICGMEDTPLQIALDREHIKATTVPQGARTYRMFTREQLRSLWVFARMSELGVKPSVAKLAVESLEVELPHIRPAGGLKYIVVLPEQVFYVGRDESPERALSGSAFVLDYEAMETHLDRETRNLRSLENRKS